MDAHGTIIKNLTIDGLIQIFYRTLLLREPEEGGIDNWRPIMEAEGVEFVLRAFLKSSEFISKLDQFADLLPFDQAPRQIIETEIDAEAMTRLWERVAKTWTKLGQEDPYYSVLTDPQWHGVSAHDRLESFYATGAGDLGRLAAWLQRNGLSMDDHKICLEYGCGVGRFTEHLAQKFRHVVAIDVSPAHLDLAKKRGEARKISSRVEYARVGSSTDLSRLKHVDFFYSVIVLQHNPPPIIASILEAAFEGLNRNGIAFFQVPTRRPDGYSFRVADYLRSDGDGHMEMHAIDQAAVFRLAQRYGVRPVEVQPDRCADRAGLSTTFLMQKD